MQRWPSIESISAGAPLPAGYRYERLGRARVPQLVDVLRAHYPGIAVGNASCHLRPDFYLTRVSLDGEEDRDFFVGRIGAVAADHRGAHLGCNFLSLMETMGRAMGAGMVYGLATLNYPYMQKVFEQMSWQLIGIMPGFDRELIKPGVVKRIYEAVYVKVLVSSGDLPRPSPEAMTPTVRQLFELLFPA